MMVFFRFLTVFTFFCVLVWSDKALCSCKPYPVWQPLIERLKQDGVSGEAVTELFCTLPARHTQSPMGRKIQALYTKTFFPKPPPKETDYYPGVVTYANAQKCRAYLHANKASFERAYERYSVEPEIAVALLFVETRLGTVLADVPENAFYTLASMAVSKTPDFIPSYLPKLKGYQKRMAWIRQTMPPRAEWAYRETKALVVYMRDNAIQPDSMKSSIYGAVGLCQFMPSNISLYGDDGNGDGRIDLLNIDDATMSLARYLAKHGWKKGISRAQKHALLMKYNHAVVYANTILALSDLLVLKTTP